MSLLPIEKGCQAIVINSTAGNDGKFVIVGDFVGNIIGYEGDDRWLIDTIVNNVVGGTANHMRECQLLRIDGHEEEIKQKQVELIK